MKGRRRAERQSSDGERHAWQRCCTWRSAGPPPRTQSGPGAPASSRTRSDSGPSWSAVRQSERYSALLHAHRKRGLSKLVVGWSDVLLFGFFRISIFIGKFRQLADKFSFSKNLWDLKKFAFKLQISFYFKNYRQKENSKLKFAYILDRTQKSKFVLDLVKGKQFLAQA